jgi:hypothetical protein
MRCLYLIRSLDLRESECSHEMVLAAVLQRLFLVVLRESASCTIRPAGNSSRLPMGATLLLVLLQEGAPALLWHAAPIRDRLLCLGAPGGFLSPLSHPFVVSLNFSFGNATISLFQIPTATARGMLLWRNKGVV